MNAIRIARVATAARFAALRKPLQRRGYADAVADKIKLTLALPHQVRTAPARKCPATFATRSLRLDAAARFH